jgi:hypothetical protein
MLQRPEEVPIPGGTVYIRQKPCQYPTTTGGGLSHHQHIRRYMIPRDAAAIATKSMAMLEQAGAVLPPPAPTVRPHTAIGGGARKQSTALTQTKHRAMSAKGAL